ncbi:arabinosyltransferase domain-containing protein [Gordonia sp. ABSL1-1]|uniref:arabinosyltransferase domain-containing protein n=1 Tax=Gordonia sp. ABSL1-1 TaxID=3053923 RepID=UPI00257461BE|nr:arabinosyltransferase domain-containing protein [Gordonia sp. ABSL1-1]MDL9937655.1 arabinosyltransferase domain-containing protein [Gordonia sp. ABSL1-1]
MPQTDPSPVPETARPTKPVSAGTARLVAIVAGVLGVVFAALTPLLPVHTTDASFDWPHGQDLSAPTGSVSAPLIAQTPRALDATIPCPVLAAWAQSPAATGAPLLSTMPATAPKSRASALWVSATSDTVSVSFRNTVAATAKRSDLAHCRALHIFSAPTGPGAQFVGLGPATTLAPEKRPQVDGVFTPIPSSQVSADAAAGLRFHVQIDNRYESSPSAIKLVVMALAVIAVIVALIALFLLDRIHGYHRRVFARTGAWWHALRPRPTDVTVTVVLLIWALLGAGGPDDGYILNMGRTADGFGYLANYYRYYGIPEAPFDWYYSFLAHWASVSPTILWMHIPSLVAGLVSWFILSRVLLPRLGPAVRAGGWPIWAAALTFIAFWLPYCSGLRSEGIIVLGSLLTWWAAEHAIATRRMLSAALAALAAMATLALAPHGVIGVAILLVAARPLLRILIDRRGESGLPALLAPIAAAGSVIAVVVFRDQTLATVAEAMKLRYQIGPVISWHQEFLRYYFITVPTDDGALTRRVPVLLLLAALIVTVAVMLRRNKMRGIDFGPTWRLIGAIGVTLLLFAFTPTKWTIQFGVLAGLGAAIAATATLAVAQSAARSARNLTVFVSGLLFALAAATAGYNSWPFVYEYDISWFDRAPVLAGYEVSTLFLVLAVIAGAIAVWQHLRLDYVTNRGLAHTDDGPGESTADRRRLFVASSPIALVAGLMVVAELLLFAKAAVARHPAPTVLSENLDALRGNSCGLADSVLVEPDANVGMLVPVGGASASAALAGAGSGVESVGFTPQGIAPNLLPEPGSQRPGQMNVSASFSKPFAITGGLGAGTTGGTGPTTVNGSTAALPFGLNPATTPVLGSFDHPGEARLTTGWYELPTDRSVSPLLVFSTAGAVSTVDTFGVRTFGQKLVVQFGRPGADGSFQQLGPDVLPIDPGPVITNRPWRNLRVPMAAAPPAARVMRLSLLDNNLGKYQFIGITPPRAPRLRTLQEVVGRDTPVLIDFSAAAHFPCQQPMQVRHGVAQVPGWRILPDYPTTNSQSKTWQATVDGGLLSVSEAMTKPMAVPTYLKDDWARDWGALERLTPLVEAPMVRTTTRDVTDWGWSRSPSIRVEPQSDE